MKGVEKGQAFVVMVCCLTKELPMTIKTSHMQVLGAASGLLILLAAGVTRAEESQGMMEKVEETAQRVGQKIEEKTKAVVKKVEDKHLVDKVEEKLKKAVTKTAEGFQKAGKKVEQKLSN